MAGCSTHEQPNLARWPVDGGLCPRIGGVGGPVGSCECSRQMVAGLDMAGLAVPSVGGQICHLRLWSRPIGRDRVDRWLTWSWPVPAARSGATAAVGRGFLNRCGGGNAGLGQGTFACLHGQGPLVFWQPRG
jgi:hypothetical protein